MNIWLNFAVLLAAAWVGCFVHYMKLYRQQRTGATFWQYLIGNAVYTLGSFVGIITATSQTMGPTFEITGPASLVQAFLVGYGLDSIINRPPGG